MTVLCGKPTPTGVPCRRPVAGPGGPCGAAHPPAAAPPAASPFPAAAAASPAGVDPFAAGYPDVAWEVAEIDRSAAFVPLGGTIDDGAFAGAVVTDRVDGVAREVFRMGGCHLMAVALHEQTGWPFAAVGVADCGDSCGTGLDERWDAEFDPAGARVVNEPEWCDCRILHFVVVAPDGMVWDVAGEHDPAGFDPDDAVRVVPDTVMGRVLRGWCGDSEPGLLGWARRLAPKVLAGEQDGL